MYSWLESYLSDRKQRVVVGGSSSSSLPIHGGVPQGSILGPLLFLVYINDLPSVLQLDCHIYADDTTLLHRVEDPVRAVNFINNQLTILSQWAEQWRITFNTSKTHYIYITNKRNKPQLQPIYLQGSVISEVESHCNLGVTLCNNLSWKPHIEQITSRANKRLNMLARCKDKLPRLALENLYLTMIRPILEYGDVLYDNAPISTVKPIESLQRRAAIICTGAYKHTETQTLLRELGWQSLNKRRKNRKLSIFYKLVHGDSPEYLTSLIPDKPNLSYTLRRTSIRPPPTRLTSTTNSFIPSTIRSWNALPATVRNLPSHASFKRMLNKDKIRRNPYHLLCSGKCGTWLTRLRLGLSPLNHHRFTYNLIKDPHCPHCPRTLETTFHFFFECPSYSDARATLLSVLSNTGLDTNDHSKLNNNILFGNYDQALYCDVLKTIYQYMRSTNRFC